MRTLVILNPTAGSADEVPLLRELLADLPDTEIRETESEGHARELAETAVREGVSRIVSAGGDGTLNEVVNGLAADFSAVRLGVLPLGTGNDFIRSIFVPDDLEEAVEILRRDNARKIDLGRCTWGPATAGGNVGSEGRHERYFLNMSVGGFSTAVDEEMDEERKRRWGRLSYARSAAGALSDIEAFSCRLQFQGGEELELDLYLLVVANARYVASGIPAAPEAEMDDGCLDVIAFPEMPMGQIAALIPSTLRGEHLDHELVTVRRTRNLKVTSRPEMEFNVDGENCAHTPVSFEILPRALEVVAGEPEDRPDSRDENEG